MQQLEQNSNGRVHAASGTMPPLARLAILGAVAIAIAVALYLIAVRGEALLVDLAAIAAWCF